MVFELEHGSLITPVALAHHVNPVWRWSKNKRRNVWVGWRVSSWPWFWCIYSLYYHIHTMLYSCILSNWNKLFLRVKVHTKGWHWHYGGLYDMILLFFPAWFQMYISTRFVRPWAFPLNIGFNLLLSDSFMSCLNPLLGVTGYATDCPCAVWCCGLTACLLYVGPCFGNQVLYDSGFESLT